MKSAVSRDKGQTKILHPAVYKTDVLHLAGVADLARTKPGCKSTFLASPRKPVKTLNPEPYTSMASPRKPVKTLNPEP